MSLDRTNIDFFLRNISSIDEGKINSWRLYQKLESLSLFEFLILLDDLLYESKSIFDNNSLLIKMLYFIAENYISGSNSLKHISEYDIEQVFSFENIEYKPTITSQQAGINLVNHFSKFDKLKILTDANQYKLKENKHHHSKPYIEFETNHNKDWELNTLTHHIGASYMSYIREIHFQIQELPYISELIKAIFSEHNQKVFYTEVLTNTVYDILDSTRDKQTVSNLKKIRINNGISEEQIQEIITIYYKDYYKETPLNLNNILSVFISDIGGQENSKEKISREELKDLMSLFKYLKEKEFVNFKTLPFAKLISFYYDTGISTHRIKQIYNEVNLSSSIKSDLNRLIQKGSYQKNNKL